MKTYVIDVQRRWNDLHEEKRKRLHSGMVPTLGIPPNTFPILTGAQATGFLDSCLRPRPSFNDGSPTKQVPIAVAEGKIELVDTLSEFRQSPQL